MAKKIRLDFSKVEERAGWNTKGMPEGLHRMKVVAVEESEAQDGTAMLVYALVPVNPKYKTRRFPFYCKLQQNQLWKLRDLIVAGGGTVPKKATMIDPNSPVGKEIAAEVEDETGQYAGRSSVNGVYGLDILDDEDANVASDEDDEEYEDEETEEEEYEEEAEEDEDEQDLEALTLAELRKLAKSLGIDTAGLKKAELIESIEEEQADEEDDEDEDDLDDEDLEDEELDEDEFEDDEEEEEEPAPKRKAPVRKAAPATKRVVKRR